MTGQEQLRRQHQLAALAAADGRGAPTESTGAAVAHFHEHQGAAFAGVRVHHDQVQFTTAVVGVGRHLVQAAADQCITRRTLGDIAARPSIQPWPVSDHRRWTWAGHH